MGLLNDPSNYWAKIGSVCCFNHVLIKGFVHLDATKNALSWGSKLGRYLKGNARLKRSEGTIPSCSHLVIRKISNLTAGFWWLST